MPKIKLPAFLNRYNTKGSKRKLLGLGIVAAIALVGFLIWPSLSDRIDNNKGIVAEVNGHKIYEQELRDLLGDNPQGISDHDAAVVLADKYLTEALAQEMGITINDKEVVKEFGKKVVKEKDTNRYAYQDKLNKLYLNKLMSYNDGAYAGKLLVTHFSRYVPYKSPLLYEDQQIDPKIGNEAAIAKDKKYAEDLINRLYNDINSGKISMEEAAQIERKDPVVGEKAYPTLSHSGSFDTSIERNSFLSSEFIRNQLGEIKTGEITRPIVIRVSNSDDGKSTAESYFLSVQLDKNINKTGVDFSQFLDDAKKRLDYAVYL